MKVMKFSAIAYENQLVGVIDHLNNALKEEKAKVYLTERNLRDEVLQHMNNQVVNIERKVARLERREDVLQELYSTKIPLEEDELDEKLQTTFKEHAEKVQNLNQIIVNLESKFQETEELENTLKMDCEISNDETKNVVQNLAKGKSPGPDGIRGEFRKEINKGAITLIYKKCDDADLDN
ncbi:unnamed protein product [Clavelina lepadiformis]|uniref:Uncharacterized protein n=1 Tax=Clavelina lepadiformis TaxID=159417 RepID=A0ABP0G8S5_CLALP